MARSAGTFAQLAAREGKYVVLRLPSGESRMVLTTCRATIGAVGNSDHALEQSGKAGRSRWLGRRPRVRGVGRSEEHTSELQSRPHLVCRLLLEKKKIET